jgi:hypothetical protein
VWGFCEAAIVRVWAFPGSWDPNAVTAMRAARTAAEIGLGALGPLDALLPELSPPASPPRSESERGDGGGPTPAAVAAVLDETANGFADVGEWGDRRGLNPRQLEPQAGVSRQPDSSIAISADSADGTRQMAAEEDGAPPPQAATSSLFETVSEEQIESAIVRAVLSGRDALAETLRDTLTRRQRARAGNVVPLAAKRPAGG